MFDSSKWSSAQVKKEVKVALRISKVQMREHEVIKMLEKRDKGMLPIREQMTEAGRKVNPGNSFTFLRFWGNF